jgi:hypothetical protein
MAHTNRRIFFRQSLQSGACLWLVAFFSSPAPAAEALTLAEFKKLHKELQPPKDELWQTIPWQVSVLEARKLAAKEKKPIVMRVRAGHPLGCV